MGLIANRREARQLRRMPVEGVSINWRQDMVLKALYRLEVRRELPVKYDFLTQLVVGYHTDAEVELVKALTAQLRKLGLASVRRTLPHLPHKVLITKKGIDFVDLKIGTPDPKRG